MMSERISLAERLPLVILIAGSLALAALVVLYSGPNREQRREAESPDHGEYTPNLLYGIYADSFRIDHGSIKPGESLSGLLSAYEVDGATINALVESSAGIFDVRRIIAGKSYIAFLSRDEEPRLRYLVYEQSLTDYILFGLKDSVWVGKGQKEVQVDTVSAHGTIRSSLWNAFAGQGQDPFLAVEMSEIFAWVIDFFAVQPGDSFTVIYESKYVDDTYAGHGRLLAASFTHMGREYFAFSFTQDSIPDYFDEEANSVRRQFLKAPLRFSRISSRFSHNRMHPVLRYRRPHHGVDFAAPQGTPVVTIGDGTVIKAGWSGGAGRMVKIRHNGTYTTAYLHLSRFGKGIRTGARVSQGDVIGYVGSTGLSTGPHLDFRFYRNGSPVDPLKVESPPAEPVDSAHLERYRIYMAEWKGRLEASARE